VIWTFFISVRIERNPASSAITYQCVSGARGTLPLPDNTSTTMPTLSFGDWNVAFSITMPGDIFED
jgi:hypothetical protein